MKRLVIATRASRLALWQAEHVKARLESLHAGLAVELVHGGLLPVERVQVRHPAHDAGVPGLRKQMPVQALVVVPLALLPELSAHEEELLPVLRVLITQQQPKACQLLPFVPRNNPRQQVIGENPLSSLLVSVDRKRDALMQK